MIAMIGVLELVFGLGFIVFGILGTIFWIWMLVDCLTREAATGNDKVVWAVVIALTHWIGALLYFFIRRPQRLAEAGR